MHRSGTLVGALVFAIALIVGGGAIAGPSGSTQCHVQDDDCDGRIDEDSGAATDDADGDGRIDEDPVGDGNGDGLPDDDGDGRIDEDVADDDADGAVNEDPPGDAADDPGENQIDCNEANSTDVGGVIYLYADSNGVEGCADEGSSLPIDGSATIDAENGYAAIDGDNGNPGASNGYARVDEGGVHCGDETNQDSSADQTSNTAEDCG